MKPLTIYLVAIMALFYCSRSNAACSLAFFKANPSSIITGDTTTLSWGVTSCTTLWLGAVQLNGNSLRVSPMTTTNYYLTGYDSVGNKSFWGITVIVNPPLSGPLIEAVLDSNSSKRTTACANTTKDTLISFVVSNVTTGPIHLSKFYVSNSGTANQYGCIKNIKISDGFVLNSSTDTLPISFPTNTIFLNIGQSRKIYVIVDVTNLCVGSTVKLQIDSIDAIGAIPEYKQTFKVPISSTTMKIVDCSQGGIDEYSNKKTTNIYPNPTTTELHIQTSSTEEILIFNSIGEKVWDGLDHDVDVSKLPTGFYILKIGSETKQFIKL